MAYLVALFLFTLALISKRWMRDYWYPPAIYCGYWSMCILSTEISGRGFYRLGDLTLLIFASGGFMFFLGSLLVSLNMKTPGPSSIRQNALRSPVSESKRRYLERVTFCFSILLIIMLPFYIRSLIQAATLFRTVNLAAGVHTAYSLEDRGGIPRIFTSLATTGGFLAYSAAWLYNWSLRSKIALGLSIALPFIYLLISFSKTSVISFIVGIASILLFHKKVNYSVILATVLPIIFILFAFINLSLYKSSSGEGLFGNIFAQIDDAMTYFSGGPAAFNSVVDNPDSVGDYGLPFRSFLLLKAKFSENTKVPDAVLDYPPDSNIISNVYTLYYPYWRDYGWWGVMIMPFFLGAFCTYVYFQALKGHPMAGIFWGPIVASFLDSAINDLFITYLNSWVLPLILLVFIWYVPFLRIKKMTGSGSVQVAERTN